MNTTIAVAIITSISTLTGAAVSGFITFFMTKTQLKTQTELAEISNAQQKIDKQTQLRRDAYIGFLNQVSKIEQMLDKAWRLSCEITKEEMKDCLSTLTTEMGALTPAINLVLVEGPETVSGPCYGLAAALLSEMTTVVSTATKSIGQEGTVSKASPELFRAALRGRSAAKNRAVEEIQVTLEIPSAATKLRHINAQLAELQAEENKLRKSELTRRSPVRQAWR